MQGGKLFVCRLPLTLIVARQAMLKKKLGLNKKVSNPGRNLLVSSIPNVFASKNPNHPNPPAPSPSIAGTTSPRLVRWATA
jgi:hypothetical protein